MAYAYEVNAGNRTVTVRFVGKLCASDIAAYARELRANPQFDPSFSEIVDLREVAEIELGPKQAISLADEVDPFILEARRAFIVRTESQRNAARMHQVLGRGERQIRVLSSVQEALQWLASQD